MGIRDRDYMQNQPDDDERISRYEKESFEAEYSEYRTKRKTSMRRLALVFCLVFLLILVLAALVRPS